MNNLGKTIKKKETIYDMWLLAIIVCIIVPFIGSIYVFFRGLANIKRDHARGFTYEREYIKKRDRRYNVGYKIIGHNDNKKSLKLELDEETKRIYLRKGYGYIIISVICLFIYIVLYYTYY